MSFYSNENKDYEDMNIRVIKTKELKLIFIA